MKIKKITFGMILLSCLSTHTAYASEPCLRFTECIQKTLASQDDVDKILYTTRALKLWDKSIPQRDLLNILKLHAEALLRLQATGTVPEDVNLLGEAESDYQRFLTLEPDNWLPLAGLAKIAEQRGQLAEAEQFFKQSVKANKIPAYLERAAFYERQKKAVLALADLNQAIELDKELAKRDRGLPNLKLAKIYQDRARIHAELKHSLDEMLDLDTSCNLGIRESCRR